MTPYLVGFNAAILLAGVLGFMLWVLQRDPGCQPRLQRVRKQSRFPLREGGAWFLLLVAVNLLIFWHQAKPKETAYYGNPNWWTEVQQSDNGEWRHAQYSSAQWGHVSLDSDPIPVPLDKAGAQMPNPKLTPGLADPALTREKLCSPRFHTASVRNVDESTKQKVCAEYGVRAADCNGRTLEIDHLISLELGGSDDIKNLWPEYYSPRPGAHEKDKVENWLHRQVCSGAVSLGEAQREIASDWYGVYLRMPKPNAEPPHRAR